MPGVLPGARGCRSKGDTGPGGHVGAGHKLRESSGVQTPGATSGRLMMAKPISGKQAVPLEEVVLAQAFELEALMSVLERRGLITKSAVLEEIKRLRARTPEAK